MPTRMIINLDGSTSFEEYEEHIPTPEEVEAARIAAIPYEVTMRQARIALARAGLLATVDATVAAIGGEAQIVWEYSSMVQRNNPLVAAVAAQAGWTTLQIDDLFTTAKTL